MELEIPYELRKIYKDEGIDLIEYLPINDIGELYETDEVYKRYSYMDEFIYDMY